LQQTIGKANRENIKQMIQSHAIWLFTQRLGWNDEQFKWFTDKIKGEMDDNQLRLYMEL
jgi:hypothetical protein